VRYWVCNYPGNLYIQGDPYSEQNHSSFCKQIGASSAVDPAVAVTIMLQCQTYIAKERETTQCTAEATAGMTNKTIA
jgi:adenosylcobinamide amidohydrolase